jgi:two-component system, chemotaxis family, protein-glutamate methylesterase/glutaminase
MPIRVMVVDDTITYRSIMSTVVESFDQLKLVGTAKHGQMALDKLATDPVDLIFLDVEMPVMDGLATLEQLQKLHPNIKVVFVSAANRSSADTTIKALQMGALDFITKPEENSVGLNVNELQKRVQQVVETITGVKAHSDAVVKTAASAPSLVTTELKSNTVSPTRPVNKRKTTKPVHAIAIGVSTGGPNALAEVIPLLDNGLNVPIFLVQHMPPVFTQSLANNLDRKSQVTVKEALNGELVQPGFVYVAPGGKHMELAVEDHQVVVKITDIAPENSCKPSVDVTFRSVAQMYGANVLGVIMTGMGNDGQKGCEVLKKLGAYCVTQSSETCVVYGMPRAVYEAGLSDEQVPLLELAQRINELTMTGGSR